MGGPKVCKGAFGEFEMYSSKYFALCGLGGILSCGLTHTAMTPVDHVKCLSQVSPEYQKGMIGNMKHVVNKLGPAGFVRGWMPTFVGYSLQGLGKFGLYELFKHYYAKAIGPDMADKYGSVLYMASSASAEFFADIMLCPFEAVKVRVQTQHDFGKGLFDAFPKILKNEGMNGFYQGIGPLWGRQIPYTIIKFVAFEKIIEQIYAMAPKEKHEYNKVEQLGFTFLAGYAAGVICGAVSHPADTMVSKLNTVAGDASAGVGQKMGMVYKEIGFGGLWKGFGPRVFMIGTLTGLQWFIYDTFKVYCGIPTTGKAGKKPAEPKKFEVESIELEME